VLAVNKATSNPRQANASRTQLLGNAARIDTEVFSSRAVIDNDIPSTSQHDSIDYKPIHSE
jgi:hypothetical protein